MEHADLLAPALARVAEGVVGDPARGALGRDLEARRHALGDLVLDARVEALGVLADDDDIDAGVARLDALHRADRTHRGVEVERLAKQHIDRAEPRPDGSRAWALERDAVLADEVERGLRKQLLLARLDRGLACVRHRPAQVGARGIEHAARRIGDFGTNSITGDQNNIGWHGFS